MIKITHSFNSHEDAIRHLQSLGGTVIEGKATRVETPAAKGKAKTAAQPAEATPGFTYKHVSEAIMKLQGLGGRDEAVKMLAKFGAKKGPEVKAEDWANIVTATEDRIAELEAAKAAADESIL